MRNPEFSFQSSRLPQASQRFTLLQSRMLVAISGLLARYAEPKYFGKSSQSELDGYTGAVTVSR